MCVYKREKERDRDRERQRETERDRDGDRDRETETETERKERMSEGWGDSYRVNIDVSHQSGPVCWKSKFLCYRRKD